MTVVGVRIGRCSTLFGCLENAVMSVNHKRNAFSKFYYSIAPAIPLHYNLLLSEMKGIYTVLASMGSRDVCIITGLAITYVFWEKCAGSMACIMFKKRTGLKQL